MNGGYRKIATVIFQVAISSALMAEAKLLDVCSSCHIISDQFRNHSSKKNRSYDQECLDCHYRLNNKQSIKEVSSVIAKIMAIRFEGKTTYLENSSLNFLPELVDGSTVKKYRSDGLAKFLQSPVARKISKSGDTMFPLSYKETSQLIEENINYLAVEKEKLKSNYFVEGEAIFSEKCSSCHSSMSPAPIIRLGYPFFSRLYQ